MREEEVEFSYNSLKGDIALLGLEIPTLLINYLKEINQEDLYITPLIVSINKKVLDVIDKNSKYKLYTEEDIKTAIKLGIKHTDISIDSYICEDNAFDEFSKLN